MKWQLKAAGQRILSDIPGGRRLYCHLQRETGGLRNFSALHKASQALILLSALQATGCTLHAKRTMEIGSGWIPVVPMLFYVFGQRSCDSYDIDRLLQADLAVKAAWQLAGLSQFLAEHVDSGWTPATSERLSALARIATISELFALIDLRYHAPADARSTHLANQSVDIVFSNATLEHVPPVEISELFREARRLLRVDGVMVHHVDCSDHYSHSDSSISSVNFLRFSSHDWSRYDSSFTYQNRLRASAYHALVTDSGFEVISWQPHVDRRALECLPCLPVHEEFAGLPHEELCTTTITMVARPL